MTPVPSASTWHTTPGPPGRRRTAVLLLVFALSLSTAAAAVALSPGRAGDTTGTFGGALVVDYTTTDPTSQRSAAERCNLLNGHQLTDTRVSYDVHPGQEKRYGDCLIRSGLVRRIGLPL